MITDGFCTAICERCLERVLTYAGVVRPHHCTADYRHVPTDLGEMLARRRNDMRVRFAAERARMWGA